MRLRPLLAALLICLAAPLVGCGGSGSSPDVAERLSRAGDQAERAGNYRANVVGSSEGQDGFRIDGELVSTPDGSRSRLTGTFTLPGEEPFAAEFLSVGEDQYVRGGLISDNLPPGKRWFSSTDTSPQTLSFGAFFDYLGEVEDVKDLGGETIRGRPADHFRGPIRLDKLADAAGTEVASGNVEELDTQLDVWIDQMDLPVRMEIAISTPDAADTVDITADILEYGVEVDVDRPPADEVASG